MFMNSILLALVFISSAWAACPPCSGSSSGSGAHSQQLRPAHRDAVIEQERAVLNGNESFQDPGRIVGGMLSKGHSHPWAAALVQEDAESGAKLQYCGASILNNLYILTAAHCVYDIDNTKLPSQYVYVGDHKLDGSHVVKHRMQSITMHPQFKRQTLDNDIALIRLSSPIAFNSPNIQSVCTPRGGGSPGVGQSALVVGWGSVKNNGPTVNSQRQVQVRIVPRGECRKSYARDGISVTGNMICATAARRDSCAGDSGGPLMVRGRGGHFEQVGIVSFGKSCALRHFPGIYTNLRKYAGWIEQHSRDGSKC